MKVLFVYPAVRPHAMNFGHCLDLVRKKASHIPLSVITLAALTPDGIDVSIVDQNVDEVSFDVDADIVAFSGMLAQREMLFNLAKSFKSQGKYVVIGGAIATSATEQCLDHADSVFLGEAEITWPQFLQDFSNGKAKKLYKQECFSDLSQMPVPRYELLKLDRYAGASIQATRGCPQRCDFCDVPSIQGVAPRSKPVASILAEIKRLSELGFDSVFFVDDNFSAYPKYAKELLLEIIDLRPKLPTRMYFYTQITIKAAEDDELLLLLQKANFRRLFIGIESSDIEHLKSVNKGPNIQIDISGAIRKIQSVGITVWAGILFGFEDTSQESFRVQMDFILSTGIIPVQIGLLQAIPDTPLYEKMNAFGRLRNLPSIIGAAGLGDSYTGYTSNIVPAGEFTEKDFNIAFSTFLKELFSPARFTDLLITAASRTPRLGLDAHPKITLSYIASGLRTATYYLLTLDSARRRFFLRVLWSWLMGTTKNFDEIFFHLIIYKHMRIFYEKLADNVASTQCQI